MENDLIRRFAQMSDDELLEQCASGEFDESARSLLAAELNRRGLFPHALSHVPDMGAEVPGSPTGFRHLVRGLSPLGAQILLGRLQAEGVDAYLSGANVTHLEPFWFQALGGVRLFVRVEHLAAAIDVINATRDGEYELEELEEETSSDADRLSRKRTAGWAIVLTVAFIMGGITFAALWAKSNDYDPHLIPVSPTRYFIGKCLMSAVLAAYAAVFLRVVEVAVRLQKQPASFGRNRKETVSD
jgi:hypothetical protein